jgi:dTDP-4-dehydrorhamnose reductase
VDSILIIGSTGMLGSAVTKYLSKSKNRIIESNTSGNAIIPSNICVKFDIEKQEVSDLFPSDLGKPDFVINCSGLIKHKIDGANPESIARAYKVNSDFPKDLSDFCNSFGIRIIQIATDCVFTGSAGEYTEDSNHDASDVYGDSKSKGEIAVKNMMILRCSLIGRELESHIELMDWVLNQPVGSKIKGFTNHYWNGLTTLHFARIVSGIIGEDSFEPGTHHVLPVDSVSKFELIEMICEGFRRQDLDIEPTEAEIFVDRRLGTKYPDKNNEFWRHAGYDKPPSARKMIAEYSNWIRAE